MSTQSAVDTLNKVTGTLQLAMVVEGQVLPIVVGAVKDIKAWLNESGNIEFTAALSQGNQEIADGLAAFKASLAAINDEKAKAGLPPIPDPSA